MSKHISNWEHLKKGWCLLKACSATHLLTNTVLVIDIGNFSNTKTFFFVKCLFFLQDTLIEEHLQLFIAVVDAELFKTVHWEIFCTGKNAQTEV